MLKQDVHQENDAVLLAPEEVIGVLAVSNSFSSYTRGTAKTPNILRQVREK